MNTRSDKTIGVLGGMGPEATVEFMRRVIAATPADDDADHLRLLVDNNPKVPSRIRALIDGDGEDPSPTLAAMARGLVSAGAELLVIPCNTAHWYLPAVRGAVEVPVLDVVALTASALSACSPRPVRVGLLGSIAVQRVGLFDARLGDAGFQLHYPAEAGQRRLLEVIRGVKAGRPLEALARDYHQVAAALAEDGADALLVACSELSVLPAPTPASAPALPVLDTLDLLVQATVATARAG
ncbi:MAG: amino acid racemase [Gammaproteobacteria bacterium]|nr:MAG: amino acid racemase [Gammaproteobacteria bacterium]